MLCITSVYCRRTDFSSTGNLTYTICEINSGNGMIPSTGIFTAPRSGTYLFTFHGNTVKGNDGLLLIRHNGAVVAGSYDTGIVKRRSLGCDIKHSTFLRFHAT